VDGEGPFGKIARGLSGPPGQRLYHGTWWDWHQDEQPDDVMTGRFIRLLPENRTQFAQEDLEALAHAMTSKPELAPTQEGEPDPEEDPEITAAYTYLGQFTDHDLTFDPTSRLREALTDQQLEALADFRTPRFDLDNLYGRGPADQPYLYAEDKIRMLLGEPISGNSFDPDARDLPRGPDGRALIGDPRNDENRIVAQLHAIFLRFHNQVADYLVRPDQLGENVNFEDVRNQVRWHYQWVLVTDFLPRVINDDTYRRVFADPCYPTPTLPGLRDGLRLMPVEFSVAAFRFGHSMIRLEYRLNTTVERRPIFVRHDNGARADDEADLGGFRPIPHDWAIDWQFFIDLEPGHEPTALGSRQDLIKRKPQHAYKIDTSLVSPLGDLPPEIASDPPILALRNLQRGAAFSLPTGQQVARALGEEPIPDDKLVIGKATAEDRDNLQPLKEIAPGFADRAPLWAYILSEAQVTSWDRAGSGASPDSIPIKLGPVGGRIVADVFAALLRGDRTSYLGKGAPFKPIAEFTRDEKFGLAELINVALRPT
jgi:Animal haem peroxidase